MMMRPDIAPVIGGHDLSATAQACAITSCTHCGLPVAPADLVPDSAIQFCCHGCEAVYSAIAAEGLQKYYDLRAQTGKPSTRTHASGRDYAELDDATFAELYVRTLPNGLRQVELYLEGVHCSACVWIVERLARVLPGVVMARLDLHRAAAEIVWDPQRLSLGEIARRIDKFGYPVHPYRGAGARAVRTREERALIARMGLAFAVSGNVMVMSMSLWTGWLTDMDVDTTQLFRWVSLILTIPSLLWAARPFFVGAWAALRNRLLHMDLPIALGLLAGFGGGAVNVVRGQGEIYFDSVASLIFLLLVGRWVQYRQRRQASDAAELLFSLAPTTAHLVGEGGQTSDVPIERLTAGHVVQVRAGETFPADGVVQSGRSTVDASLLTGESRPVEVGEGAQVHAGTLNLASLLQIRVDQTGESSRVGQLMQAVAEASRRRAPIVALADAIVGQFVAVVLAVAVLTVLLWWWLDPSQALDNTVALLIVTCPCALGLATPLAVHAAVGRAARRGILIKGGDVVERLTRPALVLFDKTGTLTQGKVALLQENLPGAVRPLVRALEQHSAHPLARAVVAAWPDLADLPDLPTELVEQTLGGGLVGLAAGQRVRVGAPAWVCAAEQCQIPQVIQRDLDQWVRQALSPVVVAVQGQVVGALAFGDPLRPDAAQALAELRAMGCQVGILSGDHPDVVAAVAAQLGVDPALCWGGATPEKKLAIVEKAKSAGDVVMVGDGVNDAAALAAATVGVSVHGGAEASLQAADAFLTQPGVQPVVELIAGARRTVGVIKRNILFSLVYNLIGSGLAVAGLLHPLVAAILMPMSSLTVVSSSFRSRTFAPPDVPQG